MIYLVIGGQSILTNVAISLVEKVHTRVDAERMRFAETMIQRDIAQLVSCPRSGTNNIRCQAVSVMQAFQLRITG